MTMSRPPALAARFQAWCPPRRSCASSRRRDRRAAARGPATGAAPQVPRTIALASSRPSNSGALSVTPGAPGSTTNQTWMTITPRARGDVRQPADILDRVLLAAVLRRAGGGERAAVHHHVVLHVLDDERAARRIERHALRGALARSAAAGAEADALAEALDAPALARMKGSTRGPILVRTRIERMRCGHEQCAPVGLAPVQVGDQFRHAHLADQRAVLAVDPDAARARSPRRCRRCRISCRPARRARARSGCRRRKSGRARACRRH